MNCEEFRSQILEGKYAVEASAVQHLESCAECRAVAHSDQALRQCLAAVQDGAPAVPATLDASVLSAYRTAVREKPRASTGRRIFRPLVWSAVAAGLVVAAALVWAHRQPIVPPKSVTAYPPAPTTTAEPLKTSGQMDEDTSVTHRPTKRRHVRRPVMNEAPAAVAARSTPSNGFQNLMFCDPLSCPGPMQVIRIQVPATAINRVPAWRPTGGMVQADVVVGSDGIARAIRIVR